MQFSTKHGETQLEIERMSNVEDEAVSKPIVMASAAGWYVGQVYRDAEMGFLGPWSRNSNYMSEEDAIEMYEYDFGGE
tara:strand:+ start:619 stop:852 length:234 start_codon:yes stop_codon:yes gene_type:complete